jgi:hypothetical protein
MTLTVELTPEQQSVLEQEAAARGLEPEEYARYLIEAGLGSRKLTGAEAMAHWEREGVLGTFQDRPDSPDFARELRRQAETRGTGVPS